VSPVSGRLLAELPAAVFSSTGWLFLTRFLLLGTLFPAIGNVEPPNLCCWEYTSASLLLLGTLADRFRAFGKFAPPICCSGNLDQPVCKDRSACF
jgi:hypothetical protein